MTNLVQFPGLGLSFELDRVAFSLGGMNIYWYGAVSYTHRCPTGAITCEEREAPA